MRLIDADELIDDIRKKARAGFPANKNLSLYAESCVIHAIAVDAVPVVRCKDCIMHNSCYTEDVFKTARIDLTKAFCCAGKRKDGADNE
jgi:hypothetical protein